MTGHAPSSVSWDGHAAQDLAEACGVSRLELYDEVDSTLDIAHELAEEDASSGTVVLADAQRAGRGRMGRAWSSEPGRGVWCTVIERPANADALDLLSLRTGINVAERLDAVAGEPVGVKWPNDLMLGKAKLGGVLVEARWNGMALAWVGVGVGVNVVRPAGQSLAAGLPKGTARRDVLAAIVAGVRAAAAGTGHLTDAELERFRARDALKGKRLVEPLVGTASGIAPNGELKIETRQGTKRIRVGTIRLAEGT